jgi:predicted N-acyltransferase
VDRTSSYDIKWVGAISTIDQAAWDAMAISLKTPFLEWEWLHQMEVSGSISPQTGWQPCHLTAWNNQRLVAAAPLYIKAHSVGEFVFDHAWADLADRMGIDYYPKLVGMSPVTPVPGYRFLTAETEDEGRITEVMIEEIHRFCRQNRLAGTSFLYTDPGWHLKMHDFGFCSWRHQSFLWKNNGYAAFKDYLAVFNSNQRHNINRERKKIQKLGVSIKAFAGDDIPASFIPAMYRFYERTNDRFGPWGCKYLNKTFFKSIYERYRHRLVILAAFEEQDPLLPVGMSFFLHKNDHLYGRYWGCARDIHSLHFNACYYSPIEWAIENGISFFDPGIGSSHKIRRGFMAVPNHSLHHFYDPRLQKMLRSYIGEINRKEQEHIDALNMQLPFSKKTPSHVADMDAAL